jgi:predicted DsbA family dithiol-disulfide isomerase|eukprot:Transcript_7743.p1 GENE.Transcript_7743~~Transcript_7743.p1  ORF type:complete len:164 (+),score=75.69 Transcript_7743:284-775(+)
MEHLKAKYGPAAVARFDAPDNPLDRAAGKVGISFNKQRRIIRTGDSHRLVEWCKATQPQTVDPLMEALFKAYFEDARDLSKREELVACAAACGLDGEAAGKALDSDAYQREVDAKATGWSRQGVSGVPFFVVHPASGAGQPVAFSGAQPCEVIAEVLAEQAAA